MLTAIECWNAAAEAQNDGDRELTLDLLALCAMQARTEGRMGLNRVANVARERVEAGGRI